MSKQYYVYILTNLHKTVLYIGVTNNLQKRVYQHKQKEIEGFTSKYNVDLLVYYETYPNIYDAIEREKKLKGSSRKRKESLIESMNPKWDDLYNLF